MRHPKAQALSIKNFSCVKSDIANKAVKLKYFYGLLLLGLFCEVFAFELLILQRMMCQCQVLSPSSATEY